MTKKLFLSALFVIAGLSLFLSPAFAIYSWVDDKGEFHITDYPKPGKREEPKKETSSPAEISAPPATPATPAPEVKQMPMQVAPVTMAPSQGSVSRSITAVPMSAGTPMLKPAALVSQPALTRVGQAAMTTASTASQLTTTAPPSVIQRQSPASLPVPEKLQQLPAAGVMAFVMGFLMIIILMVVVLYVYFSLCLFLIAKKLNVPSPWTAWVPIVNIWTLVQAAGKPGWWVILFFIPFVSFFVIVYIWMCITENLGRNKWLGLLLLIPLIGLVFMGVLAFSKQEQPAEQPY